MQNGNGRKPKPKTVKAKDKATQDNRRQDTLLSPALSFQLSRKVANTQCASVYVGRKQLTLLLCALAAPLFALLLLLLPPPPPFAAVAAVAVAAVAVAAAASVGHWLSTHFSFRCGKE